MLYFLKEGDMLFPRFVPHCVRAKYYIESVAWLLCLNFLICKTGVVRITHLIRLWGRHTTIWGSVNLFSSSLLLLWPHITSLAASPALFCSPFQLGMAMRSSSWSMGERKRRIKKFLPLSFSSLVFNFFFFAVQSLSPSWTTLWLFLLPYLLPPSTSPRWWPHAPPAPPHEPTLLPGTSSLLRVRCVFSHWG